MWCVECEGYGEKNYGGMPGLCDRCDGTELEPEAVTPDEADADTPIVVDTVDKP